MYSILKFGEFGREEVSFILISGALNMNVSCVINNGGLFYSNGAKESNSLRSLLNRSQNLLPSCYSLAETEPGVGALAGWLTNSRCQEEVAVPGCVDVGVGSVKAREVRRAC